MMKNLQKLALMALMTGLFSVGTFAQTATVPVIDGDGTDAAWDQAMTWPLEAIIDVSSVVDDDDFSGDVAVLWSADSLYVRVNVLDDDLHFIAGGSDYNYDNVCIYFDVFNGAEGSYADSTYMYYEKNWWAELTQMGGRYGTDWMAPPYGNFAVDTMDGATGYVLELAIGWTEFDKVPAVGDKMGFDVKLSDNDDDGVDDGAGRDQIAWRDVTDGGWNNPSLWGEITLAADGSVSGQTDFIPTTDGDASDRAWAMVSAWGLDAIIDDSSIDNPADFSGDVKVMWSADSLYVNVNVADDDLHTGPGDAYNYDNVCIYFDVFNGAEGSYADSTYMYYEKDWWSDATEMKGRYGQDWMAPPYGNFAVDTADGMTGYTIELAVGWTEFDRVPAVGDMLGFDVKISDNDDDGVDGADGRDQLAWRDVTDGGWNNPMLWGEITLEEDGMISGQTDFVPTIDGESDERAWSLISAWGLDAIIDDSSIENPADFSGDVKVMWSADSLYVKVDVLDDDLHTGPGDAYNYDNVCIYFDVFNGAEGSYADSTYMYYEKDWWSDATEMKGRYGQDWMAPPYGNFAVDTADGMTGYTIELAIGWTEVDKVPAEGDMMGFDVKISDNDDDGVDGADGRDQLAWSDVTDGGWDNPSVWGEITLEGNGMISGMPRVPNNAPVIDVIADVAVDIAATVDVTVTVTDADEDEVTISAVSGDDAIATVSIEGAVITVTGVAEGTATITVSATDGVDPAEDVTFDVMVSDPTGIKEVATGFNMYPNPASSMFTLSSAAEIKSVSISNVTGQLVYSTAVNGFNADVNISELEAGMYIVSVKFESMEVSNRVLIKE